MSVWQPISTAPRDGTRIILLTASGWGFAAYFGEPVECEEGGGESWTWAAAEEGVHPPCWSDGLRWSENEDGEPSDAPAFWAPLPPPYQKPLTDADVGFPECP